MRTVYYAYNFILDFPRTLNVLSHPTDTAASGQAEEFSSALARNNINFMVVTTVATVVPWERFIEVMSYLKKHHRDSRSDSRSWNELESIVTKAGEYPSTKE